MKFGNTPGPPAHRRRAIAYLTRILLPDSGRDLLREELALGFAAHGARVLRVSPGDLRDPQSPRSLARLLEDGPALLFSVNFQGLDPLRPTLEMMARAGGRIAVWLVDNPWNILAGVRDPRWKSLDLFVTDAAFAPRLRAHGAERVRHLPLAACPELFRPGPSAQAPSASGLAVPGLAAPVPPPQGPIVFVGRSAFPGKERFFAGLEPPPALLDEARQMLSDGGRPDLIWWEKRLHLADAVLWPGKKARLAAFGAEEANFFWRMLCLRAAGPELDVYGDPDWAAHLSGLARLRPPLDYYAGLSAIYEAAPLSLILTSLQLPSGLNQRHFDVWTAGGAVLCDATPGLGLFPEELTRPVTFFRPADIRPTAEALLRRADLADLRAAWRAHLLERHTYAHRAEAVLKCFEGRQGNAP